MIRKYYFKNFVNKLDNLNEMGIFLEIYKLPKLNKEEIENLNNLISIKKFLPTKKIPSPDGFTANFIKILRKK